MDTESTTSSASSSAMTTTTIVDTSASEVPTIGASNQRTTSWAVSFDSLLHDPAGLFAFKVRIKQGCCCLDVSNITPFLSPLPSWIQSILEVLSRSFFLSLRASLQSILHPFWPLIALLLLPLFWSLIFCLIASIMSLFLLVKTTWNSNSWKKNVQRKTFTSGLHVEDLEPWIQMMISR